MLNFQPRMDANKREYKFRFYSRPSLGLAMIELSQASHNFRFAARSWCVSFCALLASQRNVNVVADRRQAALSSRNEETIGIKITDDQVGSAQAGGFFDDDFRIG